jgi:hypothetical protein
VVFVELMAEQHKRAHLYAELCQQKVKEAYKNCKIKSGRAFTCGSWYGQGGSGHGFK